MMKAIFPPFLPFVFLFFLGFINSKALIAQVSAPPGIPYQAIARNANGTPYVNANLTVRFSLHEQTATGSVSYSESKSLQTNDLGLFSTTFGSGTPITGTFASINWSQTNKFLQVEINLGSSWVDMGTQQLMSVPYALFSAVSNSSVQGILSTCQVFSSPGTYNWTVPSGVTKVVVECWGGGAGGGWNSVSGGSGGYGKSFLSVEPGQVFPIVVGTGGLGMNYNGAFQAGTSGTQSSFGENLIFSNGGSTDGYGCGGCGTGLGGSSNGQINIIGASGSGKTGGSSPLGGPGGSIGSIHGKEPGGGGAGTEICAGCCGNGANGRIIVYW